MGSSCQAGNGMDRQSLHVGWLPPQKIKQHRSAQLPAGSAGEQGEQKGQEAPSPHPNAGSSLSASAGGLSGQIKNQTLPSKTFTCQELLGQMSSTLTTKFFPEKLGIMGL